MPTAEEESLGYMTPVVYSPYRFGGNADPGRNIFAFYEPPPPCPDCPTPVPPTPPIIIPTPTPPFPFELTFVNPQSVFAGTNGTRIEVTGERFTPDARVIFKICQHRHGRGCHALHTHGQGAQAAQQQPGIVW